MGRDISLSLKKAKFIKVRVEALDRSNGARSNGATQSLPSCGPGSSLDRTRTSVVTGLRKKLQDSINSFNDLRQRMSAEYREIVERSYFTITGEKADESTSYLKDSRRN